MSRRIAYDETVQYKRDDIRPAASHEGSGSSNPSMSGISSSGSSALHMDPTTTWGKTRTDVESGVGPVIGASAGVVSAAGGPLGIGGVGVGIGGSPAHINRRRQARSMAMDGDDDACRCPYWLAVVVTLAGFGGAVSAMFLLVLGSIEAFKEDGLELYMQQAVFVGNYTLSWLYDGWGIEVRCRRRRRLSRCRRCCSCWLLPLLLSWTASCNGATRSLTTSGCLDHVSLVFFPPLGRQVVG